MDFILFNPDTPIALDHAANDDRPEAEAELGKHLESAFVAQAKLTAYAHEVAAAVFPKFDDQPAWQKKFETDLATAKKNAIEWTSNLGPKVFAEVPQSIIGYGNLFTAGTQFILDLYRSGMPLSEVEKFQVKATFEEIRRELAYRKTQVEDLKQKLQAYSRLLTTDLGNLKAAEEAAKTESKLTELESEQIELKMQLLRAEIKLANQKAAAYGISFGVCLLVGVAALAITVASGGIAAPIICAIAVVGAGYTGYKFISASNDISARNRDLASEMTKLSVKKRYAATLKLFCTSIKNVVAACAEAEKSFDDILNQWTVLDTRLAEVIRNVELADNTPLTFIATTRLEASRRAWDQLVDQATLFQRATDGMKVEKQDLPAVA